MHFFFRFINTRDIAEGDLHSFFRLHAVTALAETSEHAARTAACTAHRSRDEPDDSNDQDHRNQLHENHRPIGFLALRPSDARFAQVVDPVVLIRKHIHIHRLAAKERRLLDDGRGHLSASAVDNDAVRRDDI